ncbi:epithelial discoidin domain-containing receptor 1-like isoform X3 [Stylophora pistillata]|uniref:epithelial discoidin domain-containing receptor 1-like isoform X3 n=1 Tax=Stylophora pistillata TaxID=50429 RepID=UPI000C03BEC3|nr:epithelial discoidin domain-containing receptor 1-like isoform X3 [Stylophora pistillata]
MRHTTFRPVQWNSFRPFLMETRITQNLARLSRLPSFVSLPAESPRYVTYKNKQKLLRASGIVTKHVLLSFRSKNMFVKLMETTIKLIPLLVVFSKVSSAEKCDSPLGILIPDNQWSASSTVDYASFGAYHGRMNNSPDTVGWCSSTVKEEKAFIEVDLGRNMHVSALSTVGVLVKNDSTGNFSFMYVSQYFLAYKRDGDLKWRRYHRNDVSVTLIKTNDSRVHKHHLQTPRIARHVRLVLDQGVGDRWCLKLEIHGCSWTKHDGLVSYRISQGNIRQNLPGWNSLRDNGYDGTRLSFGKKIGVLYRGLGQLTDGVIGRNADWNDTDNPNWIDWIGWQDSKTVDPTVTFEFSSLRKFSSVHFHVLNLPGHHEKMLFSKVVLSFSRDGEYFAWKTIYEPSMAKRTALGDKAVWIEVNLDGNIGNHVTCEFVYYGWWVLISEVEFESEVTIDHIPETEPNFQPGITTTANTLDNEINTTDRIVVEETSFDEASDGSWDTVLTGCLAAAGVIGALLLCVLAVLIWRRRSRRTRAAEQDLDNRPIRIINPSKKNSLNRRNDPGAQQIRFERLKMLGRGMDEDEDDEEEEMDLMMEKCNLNNARLLMGDQDISKNLRPQSREISLEEEKAEVLAEMRKVSESSDD